MLIASPNSYCEDGIELSDSAVSAPPRPCDAQFMNEEDSMYNLVCIGDVDP